MAVLQPVSEANIEVDMIVLNSPRGGQVDLAFTVHREESAAALVCVLAGIAQFPGAAAYADTSVAKLAVVGVGMRSHAGVATRLFAALAQEGINVRLVATSEIKVSVLVAEADLERGVRALHAAYGLAAN